MCANGGFGCGNLRAYITSGTVTQRGGLRNRRRCRRTCTAVPRRDVCFRCLQLKLVAQAQLCAQFWRRSFVRRARLARRAAAPRPEASRGARRADERLGTDQLVARVTRLGARDGALAPPVELCAGHGGSVAVRCVAAAAAAARSVESVIVVVLAAKNKGSSA